MIAGEKKGILLNFVLVVAIALTIAIVGINIKTTLTAQYKNDKIDVKKVSKAIEEAGLVPTEAKFYKTLNTK